MSGLSFSSCNGMMPIVVVLAEDVVEEVAEAVKEEFEEELVKEFVCERSALGEGVSVSTIIGPLARRRRAQERVATKKAAGVDGKRYLPLDVSWKRPLSLPCWDSYELSEGQCVPCFCFRSEQDRCVGIGD